MKVLIIRFSSIGDIVLTTPVVRCLKQQLPDVEVHYLTKASFRSVLAHNPYIDKLHYLEDDINQTIAVLKKRALRLCNRPASQPAYYACEAGFECAELFFP